MSIIRGHSIINKYFYKENIDYTLKGRATIDMLDIVCMNRFLGVCPFHYKRTVWEHERNVIKYAQLAHMDFLSPFIPSIFCCQSLSLTDSFIFSTCYGFMEISTLKLNYYYNPGTVQTFRTQTSLSQWLEKGSQNLNEDVKLWSCSIDSRIDKRISRPFFIPHGGY